MHKYTIGGPISAVEVCGAEPDNAGEFYLVSDVDVRIAELEKQLADVRAYALYRRNHSSIAREILQLIRPAQGERDE